ncbi:hypothetical protein EVAR_101959_1 [Eumeta japonica]|uniref:Uncharacterized protein n=1 Tax=Eumeta variegata TaxID=151549 RepID=A0A4C1TSG8_EUMVA|nr:hypothetical protein EVAR_101959_1 [Eumeta japonica]
MTTRLILSTPRRSIRVAVACHPVHGRSSTVSSEFVIVFSKKSTFRAGDAVYRPGGARGHRWSRRVQSVTHLSTCADASWPSHAVPARLDVRRRSLIRESIVQ